MSGLQSLFDYQRTILWVIQGCQADQPYKNMSVGLGRSLALEFPDVRLQFLDIDNSRKPDARLVAETLLRLNFTDTEGILWSVEQEMVQENDRVMIARLVADRDANRRHNAANRAITDDIDPGSTSLRFHRSSAAGYSIYDSNINVSPYEVMIHVKKATLLPILGNLHGIFGKNERTGKSVICFSAVNGTMVAVQAENMVELSVTAGDEARLLALLCLEIQVSQVLDVLEPSCTVITNEPAPILAQMLHERAFQKGIHVFFTESVAESAVAALPQLRVNNASPKRLIKSALPTNISVFIDCSSEPEGVARLVEPCLPDHCWRTSLSAIQHMYSGTKAPGNDSLSDLLRLVISHCPPLIPIAFTVASPRDVVAMGGSYEAGTIVDWKATALVPVRLTSVNYQIRFDENKTYVLFGLTSDLATSLCDWMSSRGARTIVLTNRNPNLDKSWLEEISRAGVHVKVFSKYERPFCA
ncbi:Polyketide synthase, KR, partial [Metarhizium hybridum]